MAVQIKSATPAWWASTTAGCSSAAAVPLVVHTTTARPVARDEPSAKNPADLSSRRTWTLSRASRARARASGVEREPGQTTASVTPALAHSSTRMAQKVAWTSAWAGAAVGTLIARDRSRSGRPAGNGSAPCRAIWCGHTRRPSARFHPERWCMGTIQRVALSSPPGERRGSSGTRGLF